MALTSLVDTDGDGAKRLDPEVGNSLPSPNFNSILENSIPAFSSGVHIPTSIVSGSTVSGDSSAPIMSVPLGQSSLVEHGVSSHSSDSVSFPLSDTDWSSPDAFAWFVARVSSSS